MKLGRPPIAPMLPVAMIGISARPADALLEGYINFGRMRKGAALIAQARPPVYMIAINEVSNQEVYTKEYVPPAQKSLKDHGGAYVAAGPGTRSSKGRGSAKLMIAYLKCGRRRCG